MLAVLLYGLITIACAYLAPFLGAGLLQLALNLMGVVGAPMLSLFIMGIYMPCINASVRTTFTLPLYLSPSLSSPYPFLSSPSPLPLTPSLYIPLFPCLRIAPVSWGVSCTCRVQRPACWSALS